MKFIFIMTNSRTQMNTDRKIDKHRWLFFLILIFLSSCARAHTNFMEGLGLTGLKDGVYIGSDMTPMCRVRLATTVKDSEISEIKILSHYVTYPLAGRAYDIIPRRIVEKQSLDVDAVTAATISSNNIKRAVLNALQKAK